MGRKSRAKAARRAERARAAIQTSSGLADANPHRPAARIPRLATPRPADPLPTARRLPQGSGSTAADRLRTLVSSQRELSGAIEQEVRSLLNQGQSWTVVGDAVGLSRQGARQRYGHLLTEEPRAKSVAGGPASCV